MSFPQCPRCGDSLSDLVSAPRYDSYDSPDLVCTLCVTDIRRINSPVASDVDEVQKVLAAVAKQAAFPRSHSRCPTSGAPALASAGITIIDYFAAEIAAGLAAHFGVPWRAASDDSPERIELAARKFGDQCYAIARGLVAARQSPVPNPVPNPVPENRT